METIKRFIIVFLVIIGIPILLVALAGMYKFNYLANQPGYNADGNRSSDSSLSDDRDFGTTTTVIEALAQPVGPATLTDYRDASSVNAVTSSVVEGLDAPWGVAWLSDGEALVTERFGALRLVSATGVSASIVGVPTVFAAGQGGLLDVAVHPDFSQNQYVYLSYVSGTNESNRLEIARGQLVGDRLEMVEVLFTVNQSKSGTQHFGSRFAWLPDNTLLFSVGDGGNPPITYNGTLIRGQAQNLSSHLGKIMRITDDGGIPPDNPFIGRPDVLPEIYSYGHRNVQGIAYDIAREQVLASEHGSKGGDELNLITPGANYGWPAVSYATEYDVFSTEISDAVSAPGLVDPQVVWTPTVAPSGVVAYHGDRYPGVVGDVFVAGMLLRSNTTIAAYATRPAGALLQLSAAADGRLAQGQLISLGDVRVRTITQGPDGYLYALTDTTDRQTRSGMAAGALIRIESLK